MNTNIFKLLTKNGYHRLTKTLKANKNNNLQQIYVHPCVINDQPHIVYPKGLPEQSPALFQKLTAYYSKQGYAFKEDQRTEEASSAHRHERRRWAPIILFTASLLFESSAFADIEIDLDEKHLHEHQNVQLQLISNQLVRQKIQTELPVLHTNNTETNSFKSNVAASIYQTLSKHYERQTGDPEYIHEDLKHMANYYSDFPEVITLLEALKDKKWTLRFDENDWVTVASGNVFQVDKAVVHFNTRSAAQLRLYNSCKDNPVCIASPADALLHELLHAHSMLNKTDEFIAQGGMSSVMYPYKHEYAIIEAERNLYAKMSTRDDVKRPARSDHTGRIVKATCPTCIK